MICKACKMEIPNGATICPHCRTKQAAVTSSGLKGAFAFVIGTAAVLGIFGGGGDKEDSAVSSMGAETTPTAITTSHNIPEEQADVTGTIIAKLTKQSTDTLGENVNVTYFEDSNTYTVSYWKKGMCDIVAAGARTQEWADMVSAAATVSATLLEDIQTIDPTANVCFNLANENNHDNALIMTMNGVVLYDILNT